jgi:hypothetical protein
VKDGSFSERSLNESAWAASKTKASSYSVIYHNIVRRRGKKRALVALAHRMHIDIYYVLKTGEPYQEIGAKAVYEITSKGQEQSMIRSLERAGYSVAKAATA